MDHPLEPGSYDVTQGGQVRAYAYVVTSGDVLIQRWILKPAYVKPPNGGAITITARGTAWSSLSAWTSFAETELETSGTQYIKATSKVYDDINEAPTDPSEQLDGGACEAFRSGDVRMHNYTSFDPEDASHSYERFVVLDGYSSSGFATTTIEAESGVADLETFLKHWRDNWPSGATYAMVECNYYTSLPGNP